MLIAAVSVKTRHTGSTGHMLQDFVDSRMKGGNVIVNYAHSISYLQLCRVGHNVMVKNHTFTYILVIKLSIFIFILFLSSPSSLSLSLLLLSLSILTVIS